MVLSKLIKNTLRLFGIEIMRRATYVRLEWDAVIGRSVFYTTLSPLKLLLEREFPHGASPTVLQIGANDGQRDDALWELRNFYKWKGILVEPQPEPFAKLQRLHRDSPDIICENVAVGPQAGTLTLYRVRQVDQAPNWDVLTAASVKTLKRSMRICNTTGAVEPIHVPVVTPTFLLEKHGIHHLDLLVIDTEGMDAEILAAFDFDRYRPTIVQFELINLEPTELYNSLDLLKRHGYLYAVAKLDIIAWLPAQCRGRLPPATPSAETAPCARHSWKTHLDSSRLR